MRLAHLGHEFGEVPIRLIERVLSFEFGTKGDLKKLRSWQTALLELIMEVVGQIHLDTWHTPDYTPTPTVRPAHPNAQRMVALRPRHDSNVRPSD